MKMLSHQRREKIVELLRENVSAKVAELPRIFKVTEVTMRQDLEPLEKDELLICEHGGAFLKNMEASVRQFEVAHSDLNVGKKEKIAQKCLEFISSGDTIILD
jgi:DeoR/GlpR family transcriptional regulator of sugar metabolism